jgi:hypothetical protein
VDPRTGLDEEASRKNYCPFRKSNPGRPARILGAIMTELSWLGRVCNVVLIIPWIDMTSELVTNVWG